MKNLTDRGSRARNPIASIAEMDAQLPLFHELDTIINVATVPQRSPFRYPGGKTWLVPHVRRWLKSRKPKPARLIEPFAGGAIVGLTTAFEDLAAHVVLVELDANVAAFWRCALNGKATALAERIEQYNLTMKNVKALLSARHRKLEDRAFATLVRNRVQHGGILAAGASLMKEGENGKGIASRWYPETLAARIRALSEVNKRITFHQGDAFEIIKKHAKDADAVFFVDPPYTVAGRRLYKHSEIDHARLFRTMKGVKGEFLLTYDYSDEVVDWAVTNGFEYKPVAMKSRQHTAKSELLIGRDLDWTER